MEILKRKKIIITPLIKNQEKIKLHFKHSGRAVWCGLVADIHGQT